MAERTKALVSKISRVARLSWVRIPPPPKSNYTEEQMQDREKPEHSSRESLRQTLERIENEKVVILLTGNSHDRVFELAESISGKYGCLVGLDFKIPGVKEKLKSLKREGGRGYGVFAVSTLKEARAAVGSGARFIFSPHLDKGILRKCRREQLFHAPGVLTPTEVNNAYELRADAVSLFPCSAVGGVTWLKRLKHLYPGVKFIPTDYMTPEEAAEYAREGAYAAAPIINIDKSNDPEGLIKGFMKLGGLGNQG